MSKKISLGAAITFMIITAAVTFCIAMVFSMNNFNEKVHNVKEREAMYEKIAEVDRIVRQNYSGDIDETQLTDALAKSYIEGVGDKYGTYLSAKEYKALKESLEGKRVDVGAVFEINNGYLRVTQVYDDSPAQSAGLKVGDIVVKIDDTDLTMNNISDAAELIKGDAGTTVTLVVRRDNTDEPLEMTRRSVEIPTVESRLIGDKGYIRITTFNDVTPDQFDRALNSMLNGGAKSLIFDVRDNGGGTIDAAAKMLDRLLPEGPIVSAVYKNGKTEVLATSDRISIDSVPMVVLTNEKTASAAELFAQALKDYSVAKVVGTTTFGKGKMQQLFTLNDGSAINLTVADFLPPVSGSFDGVGVKPDYEVALKLEQGQSFTDLEEGEDSQLIRAIALLESMAQNQGIDEIIPPATQQDDSSSQSESSSESSSQSESSSEDQAA
ncbi:S41 family peptidase [Zongyangia hominis]|uniref:S41 family peptidase n=1 Tax=Zongyangia hominis TaxID=2763677 RepID=A0A926EEJ9_9FIRM|nr:S41 family peptidase [Zongyangia hominis]MBC8571009.1 S41 family peptidase [Zongyangia hominis]